MATELNLPSLDNQADILEASKCAAAYQMMKAFGATSISDLTMEQVQKIVKSGYADKVFSIGDQITTTYTYNGTEYECPFDVVSFEDAELEDGETLPAMWLQMHYATIEAIAYDAPEAFYIATDGLEAGTYYIVMGNDYGTYCAAGDCYQFTLTEDVPAGGVLAGFRDFAYNASSVTSLYVYSYEANDAGYSNYIEAAQLSYGSDGTCLGTIYNYYTSSEDEGSLYRFNTVQHGSARWTQSEARQWLNTDAAAGEWWTAQHDYDLPGAAAGTYAGFMAGLPDDFLAVLCKPKTVTAYAYNDYGEETSSSSTDTTYDTFFPPSAEQLYIKPATAASGLEGDYFPYWKRVLGLTDPEAVDSYNTDRIAYALTNHTTARQINTRSEASLNPIHCLAIRDMGYIHLSNAHIDNRYLTPCCVIC